MLNYHLIDLLSALNGTSSFAGPAWTPSSPCPTSIAAVVGTSGGDWCKRNNGTGAYCRFPNMTTVHSALRHCATVETLDVYLEIGGCTGPEVDRWDFPFHELGDGEMYPALKSLSLDGYKFGGMLAGHDGDEVDEMDEEDVVAVYDAELDAYDYVRTSRDYLDLKNRKIRERWDREGGRTTTNLEWWLQKMDWSQLEDLSINIDRTEMADAVAELPKRLTSLRTLSLNSLPFIKGLKEHSLNKLIWVGQTAKGRLEQLLQLQGQSLTSLEYRCDEQDCPEWPNHVNTSLIPLLAPRLQHLSINLPRKNGSWPFDHLDALCRSPSLTSLDLFFRLQADCDGCNHFFNNCPRSSRSALERAQEKEKCDPFENPPLNATTAQEMFSYMRARKRGAQFKTVTFKTGDWSAPYDGPLRIESFLDYYRTAVICTVENGEEKCMEKSKVDMEAWFWTGDTYVEDQELLAYRDLREGEDPEEKARARERLREREKGLLGMQ